MTIQCCILILFPVGFSISLGCLCHFPLLLPFPITFSLFPMISLGIYGSRFLGNIFMYVAKQIIEYSQYTDTGFFWCCFRFCPDKHCCCCCCFLLTFAPVLSAPRIFLFPLCRVMNNNHKWWNAILMHTLCVICTALLTFLFKYISKRIKCLNYLIFKSCFPILLSINGLRKVKNTVFT